MKLGEREKPVNSSGTVTDLGGMAAAYMCGIDWIAIPTTLLGAVDASIGGETAIDVGGIKNLVGAFHPPVEVRWIPELLAGLPRREVLSGYGEILKTALIDTAMHSEKFATVAFIRPTPSPPPRPPTPVSSPPST